MIRDDLLLSFPWIIPMAGALIVLMMPARATLAIKSFAIGTTAVTLLATVVLFGAFQGRGLAQVSLTDRAAANLLTSAGLVEAPGDLVVRHAWVPDFNMQYYLGVDGISLALLLLTAFVALLACGASWRVDTRVKGYFALFLLLTSSLMGVFLALDLVLFYVFFEVMLLPMYFLIALWGGERRDYAAMKFLLYTLFGSVFILIAILAVYFWPGESGVVGAFKAHSFDSILIARIASETGYYGRWVQQLVFLMFLVGFCVKLPSFPFHTWLPDAHVQAPTPISMILAGVLLKIGGYGLIRLAWPLAPVGAQIWAYPVAALGVFSILYGALAAMAQSDFKKLVAYSSISHMGYVILGMAALNLSSDHRIYAYGLNGAMFMMIAHGITSTGLFFLVGVIYDRAQTRDLNALGGLSSSMPLTYFASILIFFGAMGLPGLCGFVAEVFVLLAAFNDSMLLGILAAFAVVLTAGYLLWTIRRVFQGPSDGSRSHSDLNAREIAIIAPLVALTVILGVYPRSVLDWMSPSVDGVARSVTEANQSGKKAPMVKAATSETILLSR